MPIPRLQTRKALYPDGTPALCCVASWMRATGWKEEWMTTTVIHAAVCTVGGGAAVVRAGSSHTLQVHRLAAAERQTTLAPR